MLQQAVLRYQNRSIEAAEVITQLIALAKKMRASHERGENMGLSVEEVAFYDALADNHSGKDMGDETLKLIAQKLAASVRKSVTVDWTLRESARAHMRRTIKRLLREHKYPPDAQAAAVKLIIEQATLMGGALDV